jgi:hypothetical protein
MADTIKRITVGLSKEDIKILKYLCDDLGENTNSVIKKSIFFYESHRKNLFPAPPLPDPEFEEVS